MKASEEEKETDDKVRSYKLSLLESTTSKTSNTIASTKEEPNKSTAASVTLRSILKKVKN